MWSPRWRTGSIGKSNTLRNRTLVRPWLILAALALARIGFGYQFQSVATMGPDLVPLFHLSYAALGSLIGAFMLLGMFAALPLGFLGGRYGDRPVLASGLAFLPLAPLCLRYSRALWMNLDRRIDPY